MDTTNASGKALLNETETTIRSKYSELWILVRNYCSFLLFVFLRTIQHLILFIHLVSTGEPLRYDPQFRGPMARRGCTDVICLLLFFFFLIGWGFGGYYGELIKQIFGMFRILIIVLYLGFFQLTEKVI